jgi:phosphoribosylformimino-5-aminoimidazole carboxamide ribonucleotide (ProFAR) isomerase
MATKEWQSNGKVLSVGTEVKTKVSGATYAVCTVMHQDGLLKGKSYFAQRTLKNAQGVIKEGVKVGDDVQLYNQISDDGRNIFTSISKGANVDDIAELLGLANANAQTEIASQSMA